VPFGDVYLLDMTLSCFESMAGPQKNWETVMLTTVKKMREQTGSPRRHPYQYVSPQSRKEDKINIVSQQET